MMLTIWSLLKGSDENPGLTTLAMDEIISEAERLGRSVSVSYYEVHQEQAFDLINPKRPVIQVLRDGQGRIQLKGLSQVCLMFNLCLLNTFKNFFMLSCAPLI